MLCRVKLWQQQQGASVDLSSRHGGTVMGVVASILPLSPCPSVHEENFDPCLQQTTRPICHTWQALLIITAFQLMICRPWRCWQHLPVILDNGFHKLEVSITRLETTVNRVERSMKAELLASQLLAIMALFKVLTIKMLTMKERSNKVRQRKEDDK